MRKYFLILGLFVILLSSDCDNQPISGGLELNFKGLYSADPLLMYASEYDYEEDMAVRFQLFQFYISEVTLLTEADINSDGPRILDVDLVSFKDIQSVDAAAGGITLSLTDIPQGTYKGIKFNLGLSPDLNSTAPGDYSTSHPLSNHYWSASQGYVFTKLEGNADVDGSGDFLTKLTYHIGTNAMNREVAFFTDIEVLDDGLQALNFDVDVNKVLVKDNGEFLDFRETPIDHSSNVEVASFIADNLTNAIILR